MESFARIGFPIQAYIHGLSRTFMSGTPFSTGEAPITQRQAGEGRLNFNGVGCLFWRANELARIFNDRFSGKLSTYIDALVIDNTTIVE